MRRNNSDRTRTLRRSMSFHVGELQNLFNAALTTFMLLRISALVDLVSILRTLVALCLRFSAPAKSLMLSGASDHGVMKLQRNRHLTVAELSIANDAHQCVSH